MENKVPNCEYCGCKLTKEHCIQVGFKEWKDNKVIDEEEDYFWLCGNCWHKLDYEYLSSNPNKKYPKAIPVGKGEFWDFEED